MHDTGKIIDLRWERLKHNIAKIIVKIKNYIIYTFTGKRIKVHDVKNIKKKRKSKNRY